MSAWLFCTVLFQSWPKLRDNAEHLLKNLTDSQKTITKFETTKTHKAVANTSKVDNPMTYNTEAAIQNLTP